MENKIFQSAKQEEDEINIQPRKSNLLRALIDANRKDDPLVQKYLKDYETYQLKEIANRNSKQKNKIELPELNPIDSESLYKVFLTNFKIIHGKKFEESHNNFASRKLAKTLLTYFIQNKAFYRSPLLNKEKSIPNLNKGLAIIGDYGVGKSAIIETFYEIFKYARLNLIIVKDKKGVNQPLGRYNLQFGSYTTNSVVNEFEAINRSDKENHKEYKLNLFTKKHHHGFKNYDDTMSERVASNYGKVEIFKEIFEERYTNRAKTIISMNYYNSESTKELTLDATLERFALKYGERLYDRFFEMFNIIEVRGDSLRR